MAVHRVPVHRRSRAAGRVTSSAIRDLLAVLERPGVVSLAGGLPDPCRFPTREVADTVGRLLADDAATLQYSATEGDRGLRELVAADLGTDPARVVVTAGSQQGLDLLARVLLDPGDVVALADPAYVGAVQVLRTVGARLHPLPVDRDGLDVDGLDRDLRAGLRPKAVYVVPELANPTGDTLAEDRRSQLLALAEHHGFLVVEDDPYRELRWAGRSGVPLAGRSDRVVTARTWSKTIGPGLRVGALAGPSTLMADVVRMKQATDLHTSTLSQRIVRELLSRPGWYRSHVGAVREDLRSKALALTAALERSVPGASWAAPEGGMFVWVRLDPPQDTEALLARAVDRGVGFVPGRAFSVTGEDHRHALRLSFSSEAPDVLRDGVRRLASAL